jgi:hypothetical protein
VTNRNVRLSYTYTDLDNNQRVTAVTFADPDTLELTTITTAIQEQLVDNAYFLPGQIKLPTCFLHEPRRGDLICDHSDDVDHPWHEFSHLEFSSDPPTDPRTLLQFLDQLKAIGPAGWNPALQSPIPTPSTVPTVLLTYTLDRHLYSVTFHNPGFSEEQARSLVKALTFDARFIPNLAGLPTQKPGEPHTIVSIFIGKTDQPTQHDDFIAFLTRLTTSTPKISIATLDLQTSYLLAEDAATLDTYTNQLLISAIGHAMYGSGAASFLTEHEWIHYSSGPREKVTQIIAFDTDGTLLTPPTDDEDYMLGTLLPVTDIVSASPPAPPLSAIQRISQIVP